MSSTGLPFVFVGGNPVLDFTNTVGWGRDGLTRDRLARYADLVSWARSAGLLDRSEAAALAADSRGAAMRTERALDRARHARSVLHTYLISAARSERSPAALDQEFNALVLGAITKVRVAPQGAAFHWRIEGRHDLDLITARLMWSAAVLLTGPERSRLGFCANPDCGWLFLDETKNHSRRWCRMSGCGNQAKARRYYWRMRAGGTSAAAVLPGEKSIAVLPFANTSANAENEYFSDGMTDEIINALVQVPDLRVAARTSVSAFKGKRDDLRTIAAKLNVGTVLEGSVRKAGSRIRVTAQLINAADGHHLWSQRFDRTIGDVFAVQDEISRSIVDELTTSRNSTTSSLEPLVRPPTNSVEAYELYLRGRYFWSKRGSGLQKGLEYYETALAKDPDFALAHAGVADAYTLLSFYGYARPREAMPKALAAVERALALDPSLGEAHCSLGFIRLCYDWNVPAAEREFEQAMTLKPSYVPSRYWYASCAAARGEPNEAVARDEQAVQIEPLSVFANTHMGWMLLAAARADEAAQQLAYALQLDPRFLMAHWLLGQARLAQGRTDEGLAELQSAIELSNGLSWMTGTRGVCLAGAGRLDEARGVLAELKERASREYVRAWLFGLLHGSLGERDEAFFWLEKAVEERDSQLPYLHLDMPIRGTLLPPEVRADPRFAGLMRQRGLVV